MRLKAPKHGRMKQKATVLTPMEKKHEARLREVAEATGCLKCGRLASLHHILHMIGKRCKRDPRYQVPLCPKCHQWDDSSVHKLGGEAQFKEFHGIDLVAWAKKEWAISQEMFA